MKKSKTLIMAKKYLDKNIEVVVDRPLGSNHPKYDFLYEANYGYIPGTKAPDGGELDAYYLGIDEPIQKSEGLCIAIIHRLNDDDDRLIVVPQGVELSNEKISSMVNFQEQWSEYEIVRKR